MTRKELEFILKILDRIKDPDNRIAEAIAYINKDLAIYDSRRGQLRDQYEADFSSW
jgi:hypothetical protein